MNNKILIITLLVIASNSASVGVNLSTTDVEYKIKIKTLAEKIKLWRTQQTSQKRKDFVTKLCSRRKSELTTKHELTKKETRKLADLGVCESKLALNHPYQTHHKYTNLYVKFAYHDVIKITELENSIPATASTSAPQEAPIADTPLSTPPGSPNPDMHRIS